MSIKVNQKIWRLKKDFNLFVTNILAYKTLLFFLRKFLVLYFRMFSFSLLEFSCFFKNNQLVLDVIIVPLFKPNTKTVKKQQEKILRNNVFQYKNPVKKNNHISLRGLKRKRLMKLLRLKIRYFKIMYFKLKLENYLQRKLDLPVFVNIINLQSLFKRHTLFLSIARSLFKRFNSFLRQKRYKPFCLKWFVLLPFAFFSQNVKLFSLCIKDGLERTGRRNKKFFFFFRDIFSFLLGKGFPLRGIRFEINGKLDGTDRTQRLLLNFGEFPSRISIEKSIYFEKEVAFTYTGVFGIKVLLLAQERSKFFLPFRALRLGKSKKSLNFSRRPFNLRPYYLYRNYFKIKPNVFS